MSQNIELEVSNAVVNLGITNEDKTKRSKDVNQPDQSDESENSENKNDE